MPLINFDGADKVILGSEADKAYLGNVLAWEAVLRDGSAPVYLDVIGQGSVGIILDVVKISPVLLPDLGGVVRAISEDGKEFKTLSSYYSADLGGGTWTAMDDKSYSPSTNELGQAKILSFSSEREIVLEVELTEPLPKTVTRLAIQLEDGSWFGKRA